jgi:hypothetical protein
MDQLAEIEARMGALEKRIDQIDGARQETSLRVRALETGAQVVLGEQNYQRRVLNELSSRVGRLTDSATAAQLRLDGVLRDTSRILTILEPKT